MEKCVVAKLPQCTKQDTEEIYISVFLCFQDKMINHRMIVIWMIIVIVHTGIVYVH